MNGIKKAHQAGTTGKCLTGYCFKSFTGDHFAVKALQQKQSEDGHFTTAGIIIGLISDAA